MAGLDQAPALLLYRLRGSFSSDLLLRITPWPSSPTLALRAWGRGLGMMLTSLQKAGLTPSVYPPPPRFTSRPLRRFGASGYQACCFLWGDIISVVVDYVFTALSASCIPSLGVLKALGSSATWNLLSMSCSQAQNLIPVII